MEKKILIFLFFCVAVFACTQDVLYDNDNIETLEVRAGCLDTLATISFDGRGEHIEKYIYCERAKKDNFKIYFEQYYLLSLPAQQAFYINTADLSNSVKLTISSNENADVTLFFDKKDTHRVSISSKCR